MDPARRAENRPGKPHPPVEFAVRATATNSTAGPAGCLPAVARPLVAKQGHHDQAPRLRRARAGLARPPHRLPAGGRRRRAPCSATARPPPALAVPGRVHDHPAHGPVDRGLGGRPPDLRPGRRPGVAERGLGARPRPRAEGAGRGGGRHDHHRRLAVGPDLLPLPPGHPDREGDQRGPAGHRPLQADPGDAVRRLRLPLRGDRAGEEVILDVVKAAVLLFLAAVVQVTFVNSFELAEGHADIVLLALVGLALLRGPVFGAAAGFFAGLVLDTGTFGTLGLSSLLLTLAGYAAGRLGEATSH